jgi:hypothetical protein
MGKFITTINESAALAEFRSESAQELDRIITEGFAFFTEFDKLSAAEGLPMVFEETLGKWLPSEGEFRLILEAAKNGDVSALQQKIDDWKDSFRKDLENAKDAEDASSLWGGIGLGLYFLGLIIAYVSVGIGVGATTVFAAWGATIGVIVGILIMAIGVVGAIYKGNKSLKATSNVKRYVIKLEELADKAERTKNKQLIASVEKARESFKTALASLTMSAA